MRKIDKEVDKLRKTLPAITDKHKEYAKEHCFNHVAHHMLHEYWCSDCGKMWIDYNHNGEKITCPHCHHELEVKKSRKRIYDEDNYLVIASVCHGWQVIRCIYVRRSRRTYNSGETFYSFTEVHQQWTDSKGQIVICNRSRNYFSANGWSLDSKMTVKKPEGRIIDFFGCMYPYARVIPILKRNGLDSFHGLCATALVRGLYFSSDYEMLLKTKQYDILRVLLGKGDYEVKFRWAVKICNRNRYIVKEAGIWYDYLDLLSEFRLDTHNPKFVCPPDLRAAHDALVARKEKRDARILREKRQKEMIEQREYLKKAMKFFNTHIVSYMSLHFEKDGVEIFPLQNVTQFYQEGRAMKHCVWANRYYNHSDCLILVARKKGKRLETIEVNTLTFTVKQCFAACNGRTEYHNMIIDLVKKNMKLIKKAKEHETYNFETRGICPQREEAA